MSNLISVSVCLSDIKEKAMHKTKRAANGKAYINLMLVKRKEVSEYGETHFLCVSSTKEEREAQGFETIYVGSGTEYVPKVVTSADIENAPPIEDEANDLPF